MSLNYGKMDFAVSFNPMTAFPLDARSYFESYKLAEDAARNAVEAGSTDGTLYFGQILTVLENGEATQWQIQPDGSLTAIGGAVDVDNATITSDEEDVISLKDFGKKYYKYVPEVKDDEGNVTAAATYTAQVVDAEHPWKAGLEPRVVEESGVKVLGWFEPNPTTLEGINSQISTIQSNVADLDSRVDKTETDISNIETAIATLNEEVGNPADEEQGTEASGIYALLNDKANSDDVYTKEEADEKFAEKTTTLAGYGITDAYTKTETDNAISAAVANADHLKRVIVESVDKIDVNAADASQYIYLVPVATDEVEATDSYDEYMVIDKKVEKVGSWKVDLSDYVTNDSLATSLGNYYTKTEIDNTLSNYATDQDLSDGLAGKVDNDTLNNYYTSEEADEKFATIDNLDATNKEVAKKANADDVNTALSSKANAADVYTKDEVDEIIGAPGIPASGTEGEEGYVPAVAGTGVYKEIYSKAEVTKLIADITGGESAADVKAELTEYKTKNDAAVTTINNKLATIEEGAEVNKINDVDVEFQIVSDADNSIDRQLQLVKVPVSKIEGLNDAEFEIDENGALSIKAVSVDKVTDLANLLNAKADKTVVDGHTTSIGNLETKVSNIETALNNYVLTSVYEEKMTGIDADIATLKDILTWKTLKETTI